MKSRSLNLRNTKGENRVPTLTTQYTMYLLYGNVGTDTNSPGIKHCNLLQVGINELCFNLLVKSFLIKLY